MVNSQELRIDSTVILNAILELKWVDAYTLVNCYTYNNSILFKLLMEFYNIIKVYYSVLSDCF